jgi:hypothetical protein
MHHRFREQKTLIQTKQSNEMELGFGTLAMPSLHELLRTPKNVNSKRICKAGLIRLNKDDALQSSQDLYKTLHEDQADFEEFKLMLNQEELLYDMTPQAEASGNTLYLDPDFYDVQKLILHERGEDKYNKDKKKELLK